MTAKTANISLEVDAGVKKRAMSVLEAKGMSLSGAIRRMVTLGTRDPVFAGVGMSDCVAKHYGIDKKASPRTGVVTGIVVKMTPDFKREMHEYCKKMRITPNALVHLFLGQVAFELRIPFED